MPEQLQLPTDQHLNILGNFDNQSTPLILDTQNRMNELFQPNPVKPLSPYLPSGEYRPPMENSSVDPIAALIPNFNKGYGEKVTSEYTQAKEDRYLDEEGYFFGADNDDYYAQHYQSGVWGFTKGVGKMLGRFGIGLLGKVGQSFGFLTGMVNPANWDKNFFLNASDNALVKIFEQLDTEVKDDWIPVYQEAADRDKGFWGRMLTDSTFWTSDFADGAAFLVSAFVPGAAVTKLGLGARVASGLSKLGALGLETENAVLQGSNYLTKAARYLKNAQKYADNIDHFAITALNTASESMFEAKGVADNVYKQAIADGLSDEEAKNIANDAARKTFWANAMALSVSNSFETKFMQSFLKGGKSNLSGATKGIVNAGDEFAAGVKAADKAKTRWGRFWDSAPVYYAGNLAKGVGIEGYYEENIQLAIQRYNENYKDTRNKGFWAGWKEIGKGAFKQAWNATVGDDKEAAMNIGLGGLLGGPMGLRLAYQERKNEQERTANSINAINNASQDWTKVSEFFKRKEDGTLERDAKGRPVIDEDKLLATFNEQQAMVKALSELEQIQNPNVMAAVKQALFAKYYFASKNAGREDHVLEELNKLKSTGTADQLLSVGLTDRSEVDDYIHYAKELGKLDTSIDDDILVKNRNNRTKEDREIQMARKQWLRQAGAQLIAAGMSYDKITKRLNEINLELSSKYNSNSLEDLSRSLNVLDKKIKAQEEYVTHMRNVIDNPSNADAIIPYDVETAEKLLAIYKEEKKRILQENSESFKKSKQKAELDSVNLKTSSDIEETSKKYDVYEEPEERGPFTKGYTPEQTSRIKSKISDKIKEKYKDEVIDETIDGIEYKDNEYKPVKETDKTKDPLYQRLKHLEAIQAQMDNMRKQALETWYGYADINKGFDTFKQKYQKANEAQEATKDETEGETTKHEPTGKTIEYEVTTSKGNKVKVKLEEGALYLGPKVESKVRDAQGRPVKVFDNAKVKVLSIDGDNVTILLDDEETITYKVSELESLGRLTAYADLTSIERFKIDHQNKAFYYQVPWKVKGDPKQKVKIVLGRIDLNWDRTKLVVKYVNKNGKIQYQEYNPKYLRDKKGNRAKTLSAALAYDLTQFTPEEEFLLQEQEKAVQQAFEDQANILINLLEEKVQESEGAKLKLAALNDKISEVEKQIKIEEKYVQDVLAEVKKVKSVKNARLLRDQIKKEAARVQKQVDDLNLLKIELENEVQLQKDIIDTAKKVQAFYEEYILDFIDEESPITNFQEEIKNIGAQYMTLYPEAEDGEVDPVEFMFAQASREIESLENEIRKLDNYLEDLRKILKDYAKSLTDPNFDGAFWSKNFIDSLDERQRLINKLKNLQGEIELFQRPVIETRLVRDLANIYLPILSQRMNDARIRTAENVLVKTPEGIEIPMSIVDGQVGGEKLSDLHTEGAKPVFSLNKFFKTSTRHYIEPTIQEKAAGITEEKLTTDVFTQRFFKFTSEVNLADPKTGKARFFFRVYTKDNDPFGIRYSDTDIRLVVVADNGKGQYVPVGVDGEILENPTRDNIVYSSMIESVDQIYKEKGMEEALKKVDEIYKLDYNDKETKQERDARVAEEIKAYSQTRANIFAAVAKGQDVIFTITDKSQGVEVKEPRVNDLYPQAELEGRVVPEEMSPEDWQDVELEVATKVKTNFDTGTKSYKIGTGITLAAGRMAIRMPDNSSYTRAYNREFTDAEVDNIAQAIMDYANLFYADELTPEQESIKARLFRFLDCTLYWSVPDKEDKVPGKRISEKRFWLGYKLKVDGSFYGVDLAAGRHPFDIPGLHIGNTTHPLTSLNKDMLKGLIKNNAPYHQVDRSNLKSTEKFYVPVYSKSGVTWDAFESYKEYLLSSRGGTRKAPVYVNIVKSSPEINKPQFKNVYLRFKVPDEVRVVPATPAVATQASNPAQAVFTAPTPTEAPKTSTAFVQGKEIRIEDVAKLAEGESVLFKIKTTNNLDLEIIVQKKNNRPNTVSFKALNPDGTFADLSQHMNVYMIWGNWFDSPQYDNDKGGMKEMIYEFPGSSMKASYKIYAGEITSAQVAATQPTTAIPQVTSQPVINIAPTPSQEIKSNQEATVLTGKAAADQFLAQFIGEEAANAANSATSPEDLSIKKEVPKVNEQGLIELPPEESPFRLAFKNVGIKENIDEVREFFKENLPQIPLEIVDQLIENKAWGVLDNGVVKIFEGAEFGTGFHEAFEAVWNTLLTTQEKQALINEFRGMPGKFTNIFTGQTKDHKDASIYDIRETLAEDFIDFMEQQGKYIKKEQPKRNSIFLRLWKRLMAWLGLRSDKKEQMFTSIGKVYEAIRTGQFKDRTPTSFQGRAYRAIGKLDQYTSSLLLEGLHTYFFTNLMRGTNNNAETLLNSKHNEGVINVLFVKSRADMLNMFDRFEKKLGNNLPEGITPENYARFKQYLQTQTLWDTHVIPAYKQFLGRYGIKFNEASRMSVEIDDAILDDFNITKEEYVRDNSGLDEAMYQDMRNKAAASVRLTVASLANYRYDPAVKGGYTFRYNAMGMPLLTDYDKVINILINELQGVTKTYVNGREVSRFENMMATLDSKYKVGNKYKEGYEWIAVLKKRLAYQEPDGTPIPTESLEKDQIRLRIAFEKTFANNKLTPSKLIVSPDNGFFTTSPLIASTENLIRQGWLNNAKLNIRKMGSTVYIENNTKLILNKDAIYQEIAKVKNNTSNERLEFLSKLGIEFTVRPEEFVKGSANEKALGEAYSSIVNALQNEEILTFDDLFGRQVVNGPLNQLVAIEMSNNSENTSLQWLNPEGKTVYSVTLPSYWSNVLNSLRSVDNIQDFIRLNPQYGTLGKDGKTVILNDYQYNSKFLKLGGLIFDKKGKKKSNIEYMLLSGMANATETYGVNTSDLTFSDKLALRMFYNFAGVYQTIINSDKSNEFGINMGTFVNYNNVGLLNDIIQEHYIPYLFDEIACAINNKKDNVKIQYFNDDEIGVHKLGHFRNILNKSKGFVEDIIKNGKNPNLIYSNGEVLSDIHDYIKAQVNKTLPVLEKHGVIEKDGEIYKSLFLPAEYMEKFKIDVDAMSETVVKNLITFMCLNEQIAAIEQHKLIYGHPALYKDLAKRSSGANSSKESIVEDSEILKKLDKEDPRMDGRIRYSEEGYKINVVSYGDVIAVSSQTKMIAEKMYQGYSKSGTMSKDKIEKAIGAKFDNSGNLMKLTGSGYMKTYTDLTEADAQAYIMPDYYKDLLRLTGKLSQEQEEQIEFELAYERLYRSGRIKSLKDGSYMSSKSAAFRPYSVQEIANKLDISDREVFEKGPNGAILPTLKPQYFGPQEHNASSETGASGMLHTTFLKHSIQPKFWREVEGTNFEKLYTASQRNGVDLIGFESGEKVGNVLDGKGFKPLYNEEGDLSIDFVQGLTRNNLPPNQVLYSKYYGIQVEMAGHTKDKVRRGSQMTKLILANLLQKGVPIAGSVLEKVKAYIGTLNELIELGTQELKDELGITEEDGVYKVNDLHKLIDVLKQEVLNRELPDNIVDSLGVNEQTGELLYKFDTLPVREKIDNILNSMADRRIVSQKMNGKAAVQISSTLTETGTRKLVYLKNGTYTLVGDINKLTPEERATVRITSNDLKFYENGVMEVYVPNYLEAYLPEGAVFELANIDPEILRLVGFRIPTQSMGQIENIKIKGFLPKELGDIVVVPTEIVGKAGSDFDIDKLNMLLPNFYMVGDKFAYIDPAMSEKEFNKIVKDELSKTEAQRVLTSIFRGDKVKDENQVRQSLTRKKLENKLIKQMRDLLELPENFRQLITPNNAETLKELRNEISYKLKNKRKDEADPTGLSEFLKMAEIRERYVSSKVLVGIGAVHITSHTMCQLGDIKLSGFYNDLSDGVRKPINIRLKTSPKKDGKYSLALIENAEGVLITDLLSEAMTGFVDAAKDPFVFELNFNNDTAGTWFYLLKLGVPLNDVAYLHTQPIIEEYTTYKQANNSIVREINKRDDPKVKLTKRQLKAKAMNKYFKFLYGHDIFQAAMESKKEYATAWAYAAEDLAKYKADNPIIKTSTMRDDIKNLNKEDHKLTKEEAIRQLFILNEYLDYAEQASNLTQFVNSINYDTARTKSLVENILQEVNWKKTENDKFIDNPNDILDNTFLRNLKNKRESLQSMFKDFFVILNDKTRPTLDLIINKISGKEFAYDEFAYNEDSVYDPIFEQTYKKEEKIEILNRFQNFFLNYLLGTVKFTKRGKEISVNQYYKLFRDHINQPSLAKQLIEMKKKYPLNQALQELYPIINSDQGGTDNIKLFGTKMSTYENNVVIESFANLMDLAKTNGDRALEDFLDRITVFAIMQSGVQQSPISYTKALPTSMYSDMVAGIINRYTDDYSFEIDKDLIYKQFHQNYWKNPNIVERVWDINKKVPFVQDQVPNITINPNGFNAKYLANKFLLNMWRKTNSKEEIERMRKNKEDIYNYQLYQYSHFDGETHVYTPINRLGNGMYMTEVYDKDTAIMGPFDSPNFLINEYVNESTNEQTLNIYRRMKDNNADSSNFAITNSKEYRDLIALGYTPEAALHKIKNDC